MVDRNIHAPKTAGKRPAKGPTPQMFRNKEPASDGIYIKPPKMLSIAIGRVFSKLKDSIRLPPNFGDLGLEAQKCLTHIMLELEGSSPPSELKNLPEGVSRTFTLAVLASKASPLLSGPGEYSLPPKIAESVCSHLGAAFGLSKEEFRALAGSANPKKLD